MNNLNRFLEAQNHITKYGTSIYEQSLQELKKGYLSIHCWIRYLFPQIKGLGISKVTKFYEIDGREEAYAYIANSILRKRLVEITEAVYNSDKSVYEIFGNDVIKVRSCMLLFASVSDEPIFKKMIAEYKWK